METRQEPSSNSSKLSLDLANLRDFNQALVYEFEPEESPCLSDPKDPNKVEYFIHFISQQLDVLNTYLYIQNDLLPQIQKIGLNNLTEEQLLFWINQLHFRIADTLANDYVIANLPGAFAGQYTTEQILRWHLGTDFSSDLTLYFFLQENPSTSFRSEKPTIKQLALKYKIQISLLQGFVDLLKKIGNDKSIVISDNEKPRLNTNSPAVIVSKTIQKLVTYWHSNRTTEKEKKLINQFVMIFIPPNQLAEAMKKYAKNLLEKWRTCDNKNENQIAELAAETFYGLTSIHPYFNCNGRLSTALMNLILCSLGAPSILIRYPKEKEDPKSSYSHAIAHINTDQQFLVTHIKNRIKEINTNGAYQDENNKATFLKRHVLTKNVTQIQKEFPQYNINKYFQTLSNQLEFLKISANSEISLEEKILKILEYYIDSFKNLYSQLSNKKQKETVIPNFLQRKFSEAEKKTVIEKIESLTHRSGWNAYNTKNGLIVLLNVENAKDGNEIIDILNRTDALEAQAMRNAQTKQPVVQISNIQLNKLLAPSNSPVSTVETDVSLKT